jgi:putative heme-binding domain-containing protein
VDLRAQPDRPFVRDWKMEELVPCLEKLQEGRSAERGRTLFRETGCIQCHRLGGDGGTVGPELDGVARRLGRREILESIVEPSRVVPDAYAAFQIATDDGAVYSGRIEREDDSVVVLRPAPPAEPVMIAKTEIAERRRSEQSNMPAGMLNVLHEDEVLDLLAYLLGEAQPRSSKP